MKEHFIDFDTNYILEINRLGYLLKITLQTSGSVGPKSAKC